MSGSKHSLLRLEEDGGPEDESCDDVCSTASNSSISSLMDSAFEDPDPMDAHTYWRVLAHLGTALPDDDEADAVGRRNSHKNSLPALVLHCHVRLHEDLVMLCDNVEREFSPAEVRLRQDFASNKVRWYGLWRKDLMCFLRNNHPIVALWWSHRLHPVSKASRWSAFFMQFLAVLFLSCAVTEGHACIMCGIRSCSQTSACAHIPHAALEHGKNATAWVASHPQVSFCCACRVVGIYWFLDTFGRLGGPLYAVCANISFTVIVFQLIMCLCVQHHGPRVREGGEMLGKAGLLVMAAGMLYGTPTLMCFIAFNHLGWQLVATFLAGKILSGFILTFIQGIGFSFMWWMQQPAPANDSKAGSSAASSHFHVTAEDYQAFCSSLRARRWLGCTA
mmetsp:Transcript_50235/g.150012  ORF Transcript_50235/g.150012 Transcript_50235/m.150012 type:complete len:391 (+) Transcript_50235:42-1214(+)